MALQNLDLEEQEQLASLKAWWHDNGLLVVGMLVAIALGVLAWFGWNHYQREQSLQASALYDTLLKAAQAGDAKAVRDAGGALTEGFPRTLYASMAALTAAQFLAAHGDAKNARAQLQWVVERSAADDLRDLARLRLAALLLDEKMPDEALKLLQEAPAEAFAAQFATTRGDVHLAQGRTAEAKAAYREALDKTAPSNEAYRAALQLRLDALGG